jgi:RNA polymerase sigma-70 factor (ECF subfamily)
VVSAVIDKTKALGFDEDLLLVERFLAGDASAFESLYAKYYDKVFSLARGVLLGYDEAQDATQEVFALVHRHLHRFDRRSRFSTWLFRIAVNRSIQEARRHKHSSRNVQLSEAIAQEAPADRDDDIDPKVQEILVKLAPRDRALLALFYWDELNLTEIAVSLDCGVNAAKTRLYRARERFRVLYEQEVGR